MYHKDEGIIDQWMNYLSKHAEYYSLTCLYDAGGKLGAGKFGDVLLCHHRVTGQEVAIKKIDKTQLNMREKQFLRNELQIISMVSHPNIVEVHEYFETKRWIYIAMECVRGGELFGYLDMVDLTELEIAIVMH